MNTTARKKKKQKPDYSNMRCPYCGAKVVLRSSEGIYKTNLHKEQMLYVCSNYPECDAYVRCQENTNIPLGELANGKLRALRREVHLSFDKLYADGKLSREGAYRWVSTLIGKPMQECHISNLNEYYCQIIIDKSKEILAFKNNNKI